MRFSPGFSLVFFYCSKSQSRIPHCIYPLYFYKNRIAVRDQNIWAFQKRSLFILHAVSFLTSPTSDFSVPSGFSPCPWCTLDLMTLDLLSVMTLFSIRTELPWGPHVKSLSISCSSPSTLSPTAPPQEHCRLSLPWISLLLCILAGKTI